MRLEGATAGCDCSVCCRVLLERATEGCYWGGRDWRVQLEGALEGAIEGFDWEV